METPRTRRDEARVGTASDGDTASAETRPGSPEPAPAADAPHTDAAAHAVRVVVWDAPSAIECGTTFHLKAGVRCAAECRDEAWRVDIRDADGKTLASTALGAAPWPGTAALYATALELRAPDTPGLHAWEAHVPATSGEQEPAGHTASSASFSVRTVPASECLVRVVTVDAASQAPVDGAMVVAHPYRARTNAEGVAEIRVPRGNYRLFVSGNSYVPFRWDGEIQADLDLRAELEPDLGPSDAELWS